MDSRELVVGVLQALQKRDAPLTKIMIQKFMYYLDVMGVRAGFRFEPYTYGPFSFDLARTLNTMVFWDELQETKNSYEIVNIAKYPPLDPEAEDRIERHLENFHEIAGTFNFDDLECLGTALYCAESLASQSVAVTAKNVEREFRSWKGSRYPSARIQATFQRLKPHLPFC